MRVAYGRATLPKPVIDRDTFDDTAHRIFANIEDDQVDALWRLVAAASSATHGTMLVMSEAADDEARRLAGQATRTEPRKLDAELVQHLARIDGAILVDRDATCRAIGVILDGTATDEGDPARGARFNSAVRYLSATDKATVIVTVSEDGMIDVLPKLRPRISRYLVETVLEQLERVAAGELDPEVFHRAWEDILEVQFYLDHDQCDLANRLYSEHQLQRMEAGGISIVPTPLVPSEHMSDDYFLD